MCSLEMLLNTIIQTYLNRTYCAVFISNNDFNFNFIVPVITIKSLSINTNKNFLNYYEFDTAILNSLNHGCDSYFVYNSNVQHFLESFDINVQLTAQKIVHRKFIFIYDFFDVNMTLINNILTSKVIRYLPDFIIIYPNNLITDASKPSLFYDEQIDLFYAQSYKIVTREMDDPQLILLDCWFTNNQSFLFKANLFPLKVQNLMKTPLIVTTIETYLPYTIIDRKL